MNKAIAAQDVLEDSDETEIKVRGAELVLVEAISDFKKVVKKHTIHSFESTATSKEGYKAYIEEVEDFIKTSNSSLRYLETAFTHYIQILTIV